MQTYNLIVGSLAYLLNINGKFYLNNKRRKINNKYDKGEYKRFSQLTI
jgi:hypothetical protein